MKPEFLNIAQGSEAWLKMRLGVITASCAHDIIPSKTTGKFKASRETYMSDLIAEVCTGRGEELNARALDWGKDNEVAARAAYQFESDEVILDGGFIYGMNKRVGASPDGLVVGKKKGLELKCPFSSKTHIDSLRKGKIKDEYITQCQWSMWITGHEQWAFASFDPRMMKKMLFIQVLERDEKLMKIFDEIVPEFISEMDLELSKLDFKFGEHWI